LGSTPEQVRTVTEKWVRERYLPAMLRVDSLSDAERAQFALEVSQHTGYPVDRINKERPILSSQGWFGAFPVDGKRAITSDYRRHGAAPQEWIPAARRYLRRDVGYSTDLRDIGIDGGPTLEQGFAPSGKYPETMNKRWVHSTIYDPTPEQFEKARQDFAKAGMLGIPKVGTMPSTAEAIDLKPSIKVLVAQGAFDPLGGCSINSERARRLAETYKPAITWKCYDGAHQMYLDASARTLFSNDVKALIRSATSR
jgi:hypothetical protein